MEAYLTSILTTYPVVAPALFVIARMLPIVIPEIPGLIFDLVGVAIFGWKLGLVLALIGALLGSSVSFFIARRFREAVVKHFVPLQKLHELEARYSEKQKFWTLVGARFITSPFFDYVNYAAGLTRMSFPTFISSTFIGILPYAFIVYYFGGLSLTKGPVFLLAFFVCIAIIGGIVGQFILTKFWEPRQP